MKNLVLPSSVEKIIKDLEQNGFEAFAVGGCVRDMILGKSPDDYDVTTNACPDEIKKVFSHLKTIDTGIKHGTVTVVIDGFFVEVTTYRIDGEYKDNRRPENVIFSKKLADDLGRRDFTINALAFNNETGLVDCFGGTDDIKNRIIRTVGRSETRFNEDALRILRAIRFSAVLGFGIDVETKRAVHACAHLLEKISKERILEEFKKLLCADNSSEVLVEFADVIKLILSPLKDVSDDVYTICAKMAEAAEGDFAIKLSALLYFASDEEIFASLKNLRCDNITISTVQKILFCKTAPKIDSPEKALLCMHRYDKYIIDYLRLKHIYYIICNNKSNKALNELELVQCALESKKPYKISMLAINGDDLLENNIAKGAEIGKMLEQILEDVIFSRVENDKEKILNFIKNERNLYETQ